MISSIGAENVLGCLGLAVEKYPALGPILEAVGCPLGAGNPDPAVAIKSCVGVSLLALRGVVLAIRAAAAVDPALAAFLETRMF